MSGGRHREFRRVWLSQLVSQIGSQMQSAALHWHVYLLTGSPLALGFVGLTRALPTILFSLWGGVIADRRDRRKVMFLAQAVMAIVALGLAALTIAHRESLLALYLLNALGASAGAFDNPSRQALIPRLVPIEDLPGALSLNLAMFQSGLIAGPALAGLLIASGARGPLAGTGILALISAFQIFDQVYVLARPGKPTDATITVVYWIYENGFNFFKMGYASAASWVLFAIVGMLTALYFRSQRRWVHYQ